MGSHKKRSGNKSGRGGKRQADRRFGTSTNGVDYTGASKSGCSTGKWGWPTRAGAKSLGKVLRNHGGKRAKGVREYLCPECSRWHVGHLPRSVRAGKAASRDIYGAES